MHRAAGDLLDVLVFEEQLVLASEGLIELAHSGRLRDRFDVALSELAPEVESPRVHLSVTRNLR